MIAITARATSAPRLVDRITAPNALALRMDTVTMKAVIGNCLLLPKKDELGLFQDCFAGE